MQLCAKGAMQNSHRRVFDILLTNNQMYCVCWLQKQFSDLIPRVLEVIKALALHDEVCILSSIWFDYFVYSVRITNILTFNWKKHLDVVIYNQEWRWNSNLSHLCPLVHLPHVAEILRWWNKQIKSWSLYRTIASTVSPFNLSESSPHLSSTDNYHFLWN